MMLQYYDDDGQNLKMGEMNGSLLDLKINTKSSFYDDRLDV